MGKMVAMMTAASFIVVCPMTVLVLLEQTNTTTKPTITMLVLVFSMSIVLFDPLIYMFYHGKYRTEIKIIFKSVYPFATQFATNPEISKDTTVTTQKNKESIVLKDDTLLVSLYYEIVLI